MRRWSGHFGSQGEANAGADSPRKRKSSKNRPDAHGVDQKELDTRISQRRRGELRPAPPRARAPAPALALSPLPDLTLHLSLSLMCEPLGKPLTCEPLGKPPIEG